MQKILLNIGITILSISFSTAQTSIKIAVSEDAAIGYHDNFTTGNENYGNAVQSAAYTIPGSSGGVNINRAVMKFDLSSIPANAQIISAKLNLHAYGPIGTLQGHEGINNSAYLLKVTQSWSENLVTWNNQPNTTVLHQVILHQSNYATEDYLDIDVTGLIKDMKTGNNYGFMLKQIYENPRNVLVFCSSDHPDSTKHPVLKVDYQMQTGINSPEANNHIFRIWPNPSNTGLVNIQLSANTNTLNNTVQVYSLIGSIVKTISLNTDNSTIDLSSLPSGIYMIKVLSGNNIYTEKVIITKN